MGAAIDTRAASEYLLSKRLHMQEYVGALIAAARRRLKQAVVARISQRHLTAQQFWLIVALAEHPGVSQATLCQIVRADAPSISRALTALVERRLVRTDLDPADRRRAQVSLTDAGARLAAELAPLAEEIREAVVEGMTRSQLAALRAGLHRVIANLDRLGARDDVRDSRREG